MKHYGQNSEEKFPLSCVVQMKIIEPESRHLFARNRSTVGVIPQVVDEFPREPLIGDEYEGAISLKENFGSN